MKRNAALLSRLRKRHLAVLSAVLVALAVAACGSSGSSGTSSTASTGTASKTTNAGLTQASMMVAHYLKTPTTLTVTKPLPAAPKPGKTVVFLQCEVPQCAQGGDGFRAAASAIGWKTKTLTWQTTEPATLIADMNEALKIQPKPYAVSISGLPQAVWQSEEPAYAKAGVLIMPWSLGPIKYNKTVFAEIQDPTSVEEQGRLLADWFIADSKGTGKVLVQNVSQYPTIDEEATGFTNEVKAHCPGCTLISLNVTGNEVDANQVTSTIVAAAKANPSLGYVFSSDVALAPGLPEALKAAGLDNVKVIGGAAIAPDLEYVKDGTMAAAMVTNQYYNGWQMIDALARHAAGLPVSHDDGGGVQQILTKSNIGSINAAEQVPTGYPALFKKLWQVG